MFVGAPGGDLDPATDAVVRDRVREEVVEEALEQIGVPGRERVFKSRGHYEAPRIEGSNSRGGGPRKVDALEVREITLTPREGEAGLEQSFLLLA